MMPESSQNLYFHLGMNADDDGFCEHFAVMRMVGAKPDDLKILQAKGFVKIFDDRVLVIIEWKENNYLRSDRYTPSKYLEIYHEELKALDTNGIPNVAEVDTQVRSGQVRIGKERIKRKIQSVAASDDGGKDIPEIIDLFRSVNPSYKTLFGRKNQRAAVTRLLVQWPRPKLDSIVKILHETNANRYAPTITTPCQLEEKLGMLQAFIQQQRTGSGKGKNIIGL